MVCLRLMMVMALALVVAIRPMPILGRNLLELAMKALAQGLQGLVLAL
jgi:hypothetical protein